MLTVPQKVSRVWLLTFEFDGVARVGGLGRAVSSFARALSRAGLEVTVYMPSHGRHLSPEVRDLLRLKPVGGFEVVGFRRGVDGVLRRYFLGAEEGEVGGVKLILFKGLDPETGRYLDSWYVYSELPEKVCLFTRALIHWVDYSKDVPDLIHSNDWTSGLAGSLLKVLFEGRGYAVPYVHSIHLISSPSFPWHYASSDWCGAPEVVHRVWVGFKHEFKNVRELWDSMGGNVDGFAVMEADALTCNSRSYLKEVLGRFGWWLEPKTCVVYNTTGWRVDEVVELAVKRYGTSSREGVRKHVVEEVVRSGVKTYGSLSRYDVLALATGRLTAQKGFDLLINSIDYMSEDVSILICGVSVNDVRYEEMLAELAERKRGRVLITVDPLPEHILKLLTFSANVYVVPSRYEPFGIVSIEAQALGTPVVVSEVGGLPETVLDLRRSLEGSGVVVPAEDIRSLGEVVESLAYLTKYIDLRDSYWLGRVRVGWLRDLINVNPNLDVRGNAVRWVDMMFREEGLTKALLDCYGKALLYARYRSLA